MAAALDLFIWQAVIVTPAFHRLSVMTQLAILMHEEGHLRLNHCKKRLWWALNLRWLWDPKGLSNDLKEQEMSADAYCAAHGLSRYMINYLLKVGDQGNMVRPSSAHRVARLKGVDHGHSGSV